MPTVADDPFYAGLGDDDGPPVRMCEPGEHVEPVMIEKVLVCAFKARPCGKCGKPKSNKVHLKPERGGTCVYQRKNGCVHCAKAKNHPDHLGAPESFNVFASGSWEAYQAAKQRWHKVLAPLLAASGLPKGLGHAFVEAEVSFGDERKRDQGNHRVVPEKALGDILEELGYLIEDDWEHYEFGQMTRVEHPGLNRIRFVIFPKAPVPEPEPDPPVQGALL